MQTLKVAVQVGRELRAADGTVDRILDCPADWEKRDPDLVAWLAKETVAAGHSVLVFCATKRVRLLPCLAQSFACGVARLAELAHYCRAVCACYLCHQAGQTPLDHGYFVV